MDLNEIVRWLVSRGLSLLIGGAVILLLYRVAVSAVHRFVPSVLRAQAAHLPAGSTPGAEVDKRIATIEDLLIRLLRVTAVALLGALVLAVFDLWSILAGIVLIIVALLFATQDVVLDYVMGFLILVEGPYFKGDWVKVGGSRRGGGGGRGDRVAPNGAARCDGLRARRLERAHPPVVERDARVLGRDRGDAGPAGGRPGACHRDRGTRGARDARGSRWKDRFLEDAQTDIWVIGIGIDGASLRIQQRVPTGTHGPVASELRRRLAAALVSASIGTGRWDTPLPISSALDASQTE